MGRDLVTPEFVRRVFNYDETTGALTWRIQMSPVAPAGTVAGSRHPSGYRVVTLCGHQFGEHRIVWAWCKGEWPAHDIDHRDLDRSNNRIGNLRVAPGSANHANTGVSPVNTTGFKGVTFARKVGRFQSQIRVAGRRKWLGYFETAEAAHHAYVQELIAAHGEFARLA